MPDALKPYMPAYRYLLNDLSCYSDEEIRGGVLLQVALLTLKYIFRAELREWLDEIVGLLQELARREGGLAYLEVWLRYVASVGQQVSAEEVREAVKRVFSEEGGRLMATIAQQWIEQGEQRGMLEDAREMVLEAISFKFGVVPVDVVETIQDIPVREILKQLHRVAMGAETLDAFRQQLHQVGN